MKTKNVECVRQRKERENKIINYNLTYSPYKNEIKAFQLKE
jgi:hypothetical protein